MVIRAVHTKRLLTATPTRVNLRECLDRHLVRRRVVANHVLLNPERGETHRHIILNLGRKPLFQEVVATLRTKLSNKYTELYHFHEI